MEKPFLKNRQYYKFCLYGFFKNLRFFDAFLILFFLEKGLDFLQIGFLYTIRETAIIALEIPSGVLADALGRRRTLIASFAVYILSFMLFYFSGSYFFLGAAMFLYATGDAFRTGVHKAMIFHYLSVNGWEDRKTNYYGHTRSWSQMGSAVSAIIAGLIVFYAGNYRVIFLASAVPYLIDMALIITYPKYLEGEVKVLSGNALSARFGEVIKAFVFTFKSKLYLKAVTSLSLYTGYYRAVKDYIQPLLKAFALAVPVFAWLSDDKKTALMVGVIYFFIYLVNAFASRRSDRFLKLFRDTATAMNRSILLGFIAAALTGLAFFTGIYVLAIFGFLLIVVMENLRKPIGIALVADLTKDEAMASSLSAESQAKSLFTAIISPVLGWFADLYGPGAAIAAVALLLLGFFPLYLLRSGKSQPKT